ncbi:hypothetical protein [Brevibacterium sp.]|uniref:hypothetical protein n=1 Tax=Brevibacterium sp. TaxID=1701 RepID=UPI002810C09B|nr:hypothetical protein [Brevibacterium sp.]
MKKLLLAPAIALALSGLVASPVAAAEPSAATDTASSAARSASEEPTADTTPTEEAEAPTQKPPAEPKQEPAAESPEKKTAEQPEKKAPEQPTKKAAEQPKKAAAPKVTKPAPTPNEPAAAGDDADQSKDDTGKSEEGADEEKPEPIKADLDVAESTITAEEFAEEGVTVSVTGLKKGDVVKDSTSGTAVTVSADGKHTETVRYQDDPDSLEAGPQRITVTVSRDGVPSETLSDSITIQAMALDASLTVIPEEITTADLANQDKGFQITVDGLRAGDRVQDSLTGDDPESVDGNSFSKRIYWRGDAAQLTPGPLDFTVTVVRGEGEDKQEQELKGTITVIDPKDDDKNDDGKVDGKDDDKGDDKKDDAPAEAPADATLSVTPKKIEAADFADSDKGVTLSVDDCEPGSTVHFEVTPKGINVTAYESTRTADDEGGASVSVFGTSDNASAYVGAYTVKATCGDDAMDGAFTVVAGAAGGDDSGNSGDLPRTGADLGALSAGAMLLLIGGAAVALTGRKKGGQSSTKI